MTPIRTALAALALAAAGSASAVEYSVIQPAEGKLSFTSRQMGVPVDGRFRKFNAAIAFDPAKPAQASARVEIDLASIDAGSADANNEVVGRQWFNAKSFPTASFVSTAVRPLGGDRYEVAGKLTIKGKTQDVSAPFTVRQEAGKARFDGTLTLKRLDFAIGEGPWADVATVANEVQIRIQLVAAARQ